MDLNKEISIPSLLKIGSGKLVKIGKYLYDRKYMKVSLFFSEGIESVAGAKLYEGFKKYGIKNGAQRLYLRYKHRKYNIHGF